MGLLLTISRIYVPRWIQKRKLERLFQATAGAFRVDCPPTTGLSYNECLKKYAGFTNEQAARAIQQGREQEVQLRLRENAYRIGQQFKADFNINTPEELMQMGALVYKLLQINFRGEPQGNIVINQCFFSAYYSVKVCRLISSLDEGLLTGLAGGGKLSFSQRITEGHECCQACLELPGRPG